MASDWQQWYMHKIDAWQGSATVQTFTDAAYRAFHHLIMAQFQQEDGKLPESDLELAKHSRAGVLWSKARRGLPTIREEVMAHFVSDGGGRIYNRVQFAVWEGSRKRHLAHVDRTEKAVAAKAAKRAHQHDQNESLLDGLGEQNEPSTGAQRDEVEVEVGSRKEEVGSNNASSAAPSAPPAFDDNGAPLVLLTVNGDLWPVMAEDCVAWAEAYPGVNVLTEIKKARVWLDANPKNRKTAAGMKRFLVSWLSRAQNQSHPGGGTGNGYGNRAQARTDGNLTAARVAADRLASRIVDRAGGGARG